MRVGDAEREAAAAEVREHFASGRLTQEELNERLDQTFAAKTRGDLDAVFTDLPSASWRDGAVGGARTTAGGAYGGLLVARTARAAVDRLGHCYRRAVRRRRQRAVR